MDNLRRANEAFKKASGNSKKGGNQDAFRHFQHALQTRLQTIMIGDVAAIEEMLGSLWGHGKTAQDKTEEELWWLKRWQTLRNRILDNGNKQLRCLLAELNKLDVSPRMYQWEFKNG